MKRVGNHGIEREGGGFQLLSWLFFVGIFLAWNVGEAAAVGSFSVDTSNRRDVLAFYQNVYLASEGFESRINWSGHIGSCTAGSTDQAFQNDVLRRVNFYRALAGVSSDVVIDSSALAETQAAALMISANKKLSHWPSSSWKCYTVAGAQAAGRSNLVLQDYGPDSIDIYMRDYGLGNESVGHRRWLLYSRVGMLATGDIPPNGGYPAANALLVQNHLRPATEPKFVSWPNEGYVPVNLVPVRWSLSYPGASFGSATVSVSRDGVDVGAIVISRDIQGYGDNSLVWEVAGLPDSVSEDVSYQVTVHGIGKAVVGSKSYTVILFNPNALEEEIVIQGSNVLPVSGATYGFSPIEDASLYELAVSKERVGDWTEDAEDTTAAQIVSKTTAGYSLRQNGRAHLGEKSFQLTFPPGVFEEQYFVVDRDVIPSASSQLGYYDFAGFSMGTCTLETQISEDGGLNWVTLFHRNGVGLNIDSRWNHRTLDLSAYEGKVVRFRFILKSRGGGVYAGTTANFGFFIDDIKVSNSVELVDETRTILEASETGFRLDASSVGAELVEGDEYVVRIRPKLGFTWFPYGRPKTVTVVGLYDYDAWISNLYPEASGGFGADYDGDGIPNGVEYAFQLDPENATSGGELPQLVLEGDGVKFDYEAPEAVLGVTYGAQSSEDMVSWTDLPDEGSGNRHVFRASVGGEKPVFLRHKITLEP